MEPIRFDFHKGLSSLQNLADTCRADEDCRRRVEEHPREVLREYGMHVPENMDVNVVLNTEDTFYLSFPTDPNQELSDEALSAVAGGKTVSSAGSAGTLSTVPSCASTVSSVGTAGSRAPENS